MRVTRSPSRSQVLPQPDSKAILGVAYKYATGLTIGSHAFSADKFGAAGVLLGLGFEIKERSRVALEGAVRHDPGWLKSMNSTAVSKLLS